MNNRDIAKVGFAVLAAVMSYNFADTIVHAEETSVEPVKETAPVENQDDLTDVIDAVVEDTDVTEETTVPEETEDENVKTYIENKMETENLTNENFAFFYYNEDTKKYYFYNEKKWFTAASTSKVPIAMLYYDKLNEGEITKNSTYKYESGTYEVGDGLTAYKYDVGDYIPVSFLLEQMIVNSDNTATNILSLGLRRKNIL